MLHDTLSWKSHIDNLVSKLSYALWTLQSVVSEGTLRAVYFTYVHSILNYGIILWTNCSESNKIFKLQKMTLRINTRSKSKHLWRELFKELDILPLYSKYISSVSICVTQNKHLYTTNQEMYNVNTRYKTNLHPPISNISKYQKGPHYSRIKFY
jgi:vesicle coat complex subunit